MTTMNTIYFNRDTQEYRPVFSPFWRRAIAGLVYVSYVFSLSLVPSFGVQAAPIVDPHAPISFAPTITTSAGGVPVVNITTPNAAGISLNQYQTFNVDAIGLILNNSLVGGSTLLGGAVGANPNLNGHSATVIVNQVTSNYPSTLSGAIEVFGSAASVVVVNPNGITCNGCGTNNAPGFTLTTGTPVWQSSGATSAFAAASGIAYDVQGGSINFVGQGLEGTRSRVDVVGAQVNVDAAVRGADQLNIIAGAQTVQGMPGAVVATKPLTNSPQNGSYAINATSLGAITAGSINIIVSGAGFGVRSDASMATSSGNLSIAANGDVRVAGLTSASGMQVNASGDIVGNQIIGVGDVSLTAGGSVTSTQRTETGGNLTVQTGSDIRLSGTTLVNNNVNLTSGNDTALAGIVQVGTTGANGNLTVNGGGAVTINGQVGIYGDVKATSAGDLIAAGTLTANGQVNLQSQRGISLPASISAQGAVNVTSNGSLTASGPISGNGDVSLSAGADLTTSGVLFSGAVLNLTAGNNLSVSGGIGSVGGVNMQAAGTANLSSLSVSGNLGLTTNGTITADGLSATGSLGLISNAGAVNVTGPVQAGLDLNITAAQNIAVGGNAQAARNVTLTSGTDTKVTGSVTAGTGNVTINATGGIAVTDLVGAGTNVNLTSGADTSITGNVVANGNVMAQSGGALTIGGNVTAQGSASLGATGNLSLTGKLTTGQNATLKTSTGDITLSNSTVVGGDLTANAGRDLQVGGALTVNGNITAHSGRDATFSSGLNPGLDAQVTAGRDLTVTGNATANGNLGLTAVNTLNVTGYTSASGNVSATAGSVQLAGPVYGGQDVSITQTSGALNLAPVVQAGRDLRLTGDSITTQSDAIAGRDLTVTANNGSYTANAGVQAMRDITVNGSSGVTLAQGATGGGTMTVNAGNGVLHSVGVLSSVSDASLSGQGIVLDDKLVTNGNAILTSTAGSTTQAVSAQGNITSTANGNIVHQGDLNAGGAISVTSAAGDISTKNLTSTNGMTVAANGSISDQGNLNSGGAMSLTATHGSLTTNGSLAAAGDVQVTAGQSMGVTGDVLSNQAVGLTAGNSITIAGKAIGLTSTNLNAGQGITVGGTLASNGAVQATATNGTFSVGNGVGGSTVALAAGTDIQVTGPLQSKGNTTLTSGRDTMVTGTVAVGTVTNGSPSIGSGDLNVTAGRSVNLANTVEVVGSQTINAQTGSVTLGAGQVGGVATINAAQNITFSNASFESLQSIALNATSGSINGAANVSATTGLSETAGLDIINTGNATGNTGVTLTAGRTIGVGGNLASGANLSATATQNLTVLGTAYANGQGSLTATQGTVQAGTVATLSTLNVTAGQNIITSGNLTAGDPAATSAVPVNVTLNAGNSIQIGNASSAGNLQATGNVSATAGNGMIVYGNAVSPGVVSLTAGAGGIGVAQGLTSGADTNLTTTALGNVVIVQDAVVNGNANLNIAGNTTIGGNFGVLHDLVYSGGSQAGGGNITVGGKTVVNGKTNVNTTGLTTLSGANYFLGSPIQWNSAGGIVLGGLTYLANSASLTANNGSITANGDLYATADLTLSAGHTINLNGNTTVQGVANFSTAAGGAINNSGALTLAQDLTVNTAGDFNSTSTLQTPGKLNITAANTSLTGTTSVLGDASFQNTGALTLGGTFTTNGTLTAHANTVTTTGNVMGVQNINLSGANLNNNGQLLTQGDINATFTNTVTQNSNGVMVGKNIGITASNSATLGGQVVASTQLTVNAPALNVGGVLSAPQVTLNTHALDNSGTIQSPSLNFTGSNLSITNSGTLYTTGGLNLSTSSFNQTAGTTEADAGLTLFSGQVGNNGLIYSPGTVNIQAATLSNGGNIVGSFTTVTSPTLHNQGNISSTVGDLNITATSWLDNGGNLVSNTGQLIVHSNAQTTNSGLMDSAGKLTLDGGGSLQNGGSIASGGDIGLATADITNNGTIAAGGKLSVSAGSITNTASQTAHCTVLQQGQPCQTVYTLSPARITGAGDVGISASALNNGGVVASGGKLTLSISGDITNTPNPNESQSDSNAGQPANQQQASTGVISAVGDVAITAANINSQGVIVSGGAAGGDVKLTVAGTVTNSGQFGLIQGGTVEINSAHLYNLSDGSNAAHIAAIGSVVLTGGGGGFTNSGVISSQNGDVTVSGYGTGTNIGGQAVIQAPTGKVTLSGTGGSSFSNSGGTIYANGDLSILNFGSYSAMAIGGASSKSGVYSKTGNVNLSAGGALDAASINSLMTSAAGNVNLLQGNDINVGSGSWTVAGNVNNAGNITVGQGGFVNVGGNLTSTSLSNTAGDVGIGGKLTTGAINNNAAYTAYTALESVPQGTNLDVFYASSLVDGSTALGSCPPTAVTCNVSRGYFGSYTPGQIVVIGDVSFSSINNIGSFLFVGGGVGPTNANVSGTVTNQTVAQQISWTTASGPPLSGISTEDASKVGGQASIQIGGSFTSGGVNNAGVISVGGSASISGTSVNGITDPSVQTVIASGTSSHGTTSAGATTTTTSTTTAPQHTVQVNGIPYTYQPAAPPTGCSVDSPCAPVVGSYVDAHGNLLPNPLDLSATAPNALNCGNNDGAPCVSARIPANLSPNPFNTPPGSTLAVISGTTQGPPPVNDSVTPVVPTSLPPNVKAGVTPNVVALKDWQAGKGELIDTSNLAGLPQGSLNVVGTLNLDGGNFTNTGFINAGTISLNNVDLTNAKRLANSTYSNYIADDSWSVSTGYGVQPGGVMNANNWIIKNVQLDANGKAVQPLLVTTGADGEQTTSAVYQPDDRRGSISCVGNCSFGISGGSPDENAAFNNTLVTAFGSTYSSTALEDMLNTISQTPPLPWYETGVVAVVAIIVTAIINFFCEGCATSALMEETSWLAVETALVKTLIQAVESGDWNPVNFIVAAGQAFMMAGLQESIGSVIKMDGVPLNSITAANSTFMTLLERNLISGGLNGIINAVMHGQPLNLENIATGALINTAGALGAYQIGNWATPSESNLNPIDAFSALLLHAGLGCVMGSAMAGNGSGCASGATGAVVGDVAAHTALNNGATPDQALKIGDIAAQVAGLAVGGDAGANIASATGTNAVANNELLHLKPILNVTQPDPNMVASGYVAKQYPDGTYCNAGGGGPCIDPSNTSDNPAADQARADVGTGALKGIGSIPFTLANTTAMAVNGYGYGYQMLFGMPQGDILTPIDLPAALQPTNGYQSAGFIWGNFWGTAALTAGTDLLGNPWAITATGANASGAAAGEGAATTPKLPIATDGTATSPYSSTGKTYSNTTLTDANGNPIPTGASVPSVSANAGAAPIGTWTSVNESMSARAATYQTQITGQAGQAYVVNGVKFDGFTDGVLLDAKGPGYATFVDSNGQFKPWFTGDQSLLTQAASQINAAGGSPIIWHVAEPSAATAIQNLLQTNGFGTIKVVNTLPK